MLEAGEDAAVEATKWCRLYLPKTTECVALLVSQTEELALARRGAQLDLPGLSMTVHNQKGDEVRFSHEAGADPLIECQAFCDKHFPQVTLQACTTQMLTNLQEAFEELHPRRQDGGL